MKREANSRSVNASSTPVPRGPYKANAMSRYVELVLVVDNKIYEDQDKDLQRVYRRCRDIANIVNAVKTPPNPTLDASSLVEVS